LKHPITKNRAGGVAQGKCPEFKTHYCKKKKSEKPVKLKKVLKIR
jgi:hypothetical protein